MHNTVLRQCAPIVAGARPFRKETYPEQWCQALSFQVWLFRAWLPPGLSYPGWSYPDSCCFPDCWFPELPLAWAQPFPASELRCLAWARLWNLPGSGSCQGWHSKKAESIPELQRSPARDWLPASSAPPPDSLPEKPLSVLPFRTVGQLGPQCRLQTQHQLRLRRPILHRPASHWASPMPIPPVRRAMPPALFRSGWWCWRRCSYPPAWLHWRLGTNSRPQTSKTRCPQESEPKGTRRKGLRPLARLPAPCFPPKCADCHFLL